MEIYESLTLAEKIDIASNLQIQICLDDLQTQIESGKITNQQAKSISLQYMKSREFEQAVFSWVRQMTVAA